MFYVIDNDGVLQWDVSDADFIPEGLDYTDIPLPVGMVRPKLENGAWVDLGPVVYVPTHEDLCFNERLWRNAELARADIELNKVQDGVGSGTVSAWREYRCALRDWPEDSNFPQADKRPTAPDA